MPLRKSTKKRQRNNIDYNKLVTGGIIGKVTLHDVKVYGNKNSFLKDKNKHLKLQILKIIVMDFW